MWRLLLILPALALLALVAGPAHACARPPGSAAYVVHHETQGEIARYDMTFACAGDELVVETRIEGEIRVLMIPVFRREAHYREVWRGDRLVAFASRFDDNGEVYGVKAQADGDRTIIEDREHRLIEAPATVVPEHPWNHAVVERPVLFDVRRGKLLNVRVTPAGEETITAGGRRVVARKYRVTGDIERELWYDRDGNWLQSRREYRGDLITITLAASRP